MIRFQGSNYYYFLLLASVIFWWIKDFFPKRIRLFVINVLFHLLFNLRVMLVFNGLIVTSYLVQSFFSLKIFNGKRPIFWLEFALYMLIFANIKYSSPSLFTELGIMSFAGISFMLLRVISLGLDLRNRKITNVINFLDYYNYLAFFPAFLSGPLNRYDEFIKDSNSNQDTILFREQFDNTYRFIRGAFKKGVVAAFLLNFSIDSVNLINLYEFSFIKVMALMYVYSFVLYFDFSGYTDMAIGASGLFGIRMPENFNSPFLAKNIQEFWNRWHISFMNWLKEYVFYPIQALLLRKKLLKNYVYASLVAILFTFLLAGLWHGGEYKYFYYGIYHGGIYGIYIIWKNKGSKLKANIGIPSSLLKLFSIVLTYHVFVFGLFFFTGHYPYLFKTLHGFLKTQ